MKEIQLSLFKPSNQLDFYCQDGFLIAYGEDARLAAKAARCSLEQSQDGMDMMTVNVIGHADTVFPRLVRAGFKIRVLQP